MSRWLTKKNIMLFSLLIIVILIFIFILPVSIPIILALITAILFEPLVKLTESKFKWKRSVSVMSVYIFIIALLAVIIYYTITSLIGRIIQFTKDAPEYLNKLSNVWIDVQSKIFLYTSDLPDDVVKSMQNSFNDILMSFKDSFLAFFNSEKIVALASEIPSYLVSFIFFMIALFLFMLELPELKKMIFRHLTEETSKKVRYMTVKLNSVIFGFVKAQLLVSLIILAVSFVGLLIIAPKYALVMSLVIWIIDLIPILGSIIILAPWSLYQYVSGDIGLGTKLAVLAAVLLIIRRTVEPKVMGNQIGLSPLPTLIGMFIGLKLFGVFGLFIGPMLVILFNTAREAGIIKLNFKL
ncbi:sporulation integral membrane protein YtvI [Sporosarcina highlanderae]|uniref:Sporulation integral membrane protein YtvI n=1 Tax=Sporosarcina highlanderae TaxID=3035916 RepID=A0ABT8JRM5_9BACL|nr:sporulation integral membrane protein YtvI [Sporosarcina highlanderae]MDN4607582.1 sporulation integral membrane protein YtvI [Sporosarcina highlanderae]